MYDDLLLATDGGDGAQRATEHAIALADRRAPEAGVPADTAIVDGIPEEEIVAFADREAIDLIVLGTAGRTGLDQLVLGSVAEEVVRSAPVPVVTVREDS